MELHKFDELDCLLRNVSPSCTFSPSSTFSSQNVFDRYLFVIPILISSGFVWKKSAFEFPIHTSKFQPRMFY
jgi:hypothetical protein